MKIELVPIKSVFRDPSNARIHDDEQICEIMASLRRFNQQKPIVVGSDNIIIAGNGTHEAAENLGWSEIAIIKSPLSAEEAKAFSIADNNISLHSDWNISTLNEHILALNKWNPEQDWQALGFNADEISSFIDGDISSFSEFQEPISNSYTNSTDNTAGSGSSGYTSDAKSGVLSEITKPFYVTNEQREVIEQAIERVRTEEADATMSEGRCLELICGDFLSS